MVIQLAAVLVWASPWLLVLVFPWIGQPGVLGTVALLTLVLVQFALVSALSPLLTSLHRVRLRLYSPSLATLPPDRWGRWKGNRLGYHLALGPLVALAELLLVITALTGLATLTVYVWLWALPPGTQAALLTEAGYLTLLGAVLLVGSISAWNALCRRDIRTGSLLLGASREDVLQARVEGLTASRADVLDAVTAERRRLERDLHDGAQQRLVSLAVNLGLALRSADLTQEAREVIEATHREIKGTVADLRRLVRGLAPPVLTENGVDAALSGLVARSPVPVRLTVDLPTRPPAQVETAAYFVVAETLTNIAKHAGASHVNITVVRTDTGIVVDVRDDGVGGARIEPGGGLAGLHSRVRALDGTLQVVSPAGGPTRVHVELPCAP